MTYPYWPLFDLRLHVGDLMLRPMTEADLVSLADIRPPDVEDNPTNPVYVVASERVARGVAVHQDYWRSLGTWRPESWNLPFVVISGGVLVGSQTLEAESFARLKTVDSSSWLVAEARGRGIGVAMRRAVLALAFEGLGAEVAVTSAWFDNGASLGVSRSLGYVDNGIDRLDGGHRVDDLVRMRMTRKIWHERHGRHGVRVDGLRPCLPWFGLGGDAG